MALQQQGEGLYNVTLQLRGGGGQELDESVYRACLLDSQLAGEAERQMREYECNCLHR